MLCELVRYCVLQLYCVTVVLGVVVVVVCVVVFVEPLFLVVAAPVCLLDCPVAVLEVIVVHAEFAVPGSLTPKIIASGS